MTSQNTSPPLIQLFLLLLPQLFFGFLAPDTNCDTPRLTLLNVGSSSPIVYDCANDQEVTKDDCNGERLILIVYRHRVARYSLPPNTRRQFDKSFELPLPLSLRRTNLWLKGPPTKEPPTSLETAKPIGLRIPTKEGVSMVDIPTTSSNNREDQRNNGDYHITNLWKPPLYFVRPNTFFVMRSEGLTTLRINLKFRRTLLLILNDGPEAQDISANKMKYHSMFCDNNKKSSNNKKSNIKRNKMIFADCDRDSYLLGSASNQLGDINGFTRSSRTTSFDNNNAKYLPVR